MIRATIAALTLASLTALPSFAADTYKIDPEHVWLGFTVGHAGWANAHGQFRAVAGDIVFDKDDVTKSTLNVSIDATTIDTNFDARNADLNSPDFLNSGEFPSITFVSTAVEKTGDTTGKVTGTLTMIGVALPVTLDVTWNAETPLPWDASVIKTGFTATGKLNLADFGMTKAAEYGIGPDVTLSIDVEAFKQ